MMGSPRHSPGGSRKRNGPAGGASPAGPRPPSQGRGTAQSRPSSFAVWSKDFFASRTISSISSRVMVSGGE